MRADAHDAFHENAPASDKIVSAAFGSLSRYAKPELIPEEGNAFAQAMAEKHSDEDASH